MRVLQLNSVCGYGSTGKIVVDLCKILEMEGHDSVIAYGRNRVKSNVHTLKIGSFVNKYFHALKTRLFDLHGYGSKYSTKKLIKKIELYNPNIIHLHNIHGYYVNIEILFNFLKRYNRPVIWTLHDCWSFTGHCAYFDYINCSRWKQGCVNCPQKNSYPRSIFFDNSQMNYIKKRELFNGIENMTIVTPSIWLANLVKQSFIGTYNVEVINNGIDLNYYKCTKGNFRGKYSIENKFIILGVASIWNERKGLKYFVKLSDELSNEYQIVLVGVTKIQQLSLSSKIICIAKTKDMKELAEIYSTADVFVNPTLDDNFPTTNLESLACGTPVITFDTGGSAESVDNSCGIIVKKGDLVSLIDAIKRIKENFDYKRNCQMAAKRFDKNDRFYEYLNLYKRVVQSKL